MKNILPSLVVSTVIALVLFGCKKQTDTLNTAELKEYFPLEVGKSYIYRLDSAVLINFGKAFETHSYLAKDSIEATFTDAEGHLSYRIFRYLRDTASTQQWTYSTTLFATYSHDGVEYVDNNMRFIKLHAPIREGFSWKAHSYIDTKSLNSTVTYLDEWEYQYQDVAAPYDVLNKTYDSTITVLQHDEFTPEGPFDASLPFQQRTYGMEVYAKGVGLIYKDFLYWTWQADSFEDGGYGVRMQLISHN